jgi:glycosyltransferase involved in cell wall biosynthesis
MKLIVQIPVLNERDTIAEVITTIPRAIPGVDRVEVLIIDDGCTDDTIEIARAHGADHVVRHTARRGLAFAYQTGIDEALRLGADIIVNTDGDNQYPSEQIPALVAPIIAGKADVVIGDRQVNGIEHFSIFKKVLQRIGSGVVRWASDTDVPDTVSGFQAISREAALRRFVTSDFSYTVETLIQSGKKRLTIQTVPITTNSVKRMSRLHQGNWNFVKRQAATIVRTYATYEPLKTFSYVAGFVFFFSVLFLGRAGYVFIGRRLGAVEAANDQSLIIGGVLAVMALMVFTIGLVADLIGRLRRVEEEVLYRIRKQSLGDEPWQQATGQRLARIEQAESRQQALGVQIERLAQQIAALAQTQRDTADLLRQQHAAVETRQRALSTQIEQLKRDLLEPDVIEGDAKARDAEI